MQYTKQRTIAKKISLFIFIILGSALFMSSCGGGGGDTPPPPPTGTAFWATNIATNTDYQVYSSVVATGTYCYIYAENGMVIDAAEADAVMTEFDTKIHPTITGKFGSEPDVDGDPRIYILLLNIRDGYTPANGSYVAGYFMPGNEYSVADYSHSNEKRYDLYERKPGNKYNTNSILYHACP